MDTTQPTADAAATPVPPIATDSTATDGTADAAETNPAHAFFDRLRTDLVKVVDWAEEEYEALKAAIVKHL